MKIIIYHDLTGALHIVKPTLEMFDSSSRTRQELAARGVLFEDDDSILKYVISRSVPSETPYFVVDDDSIPKDRTFRDAWMFRNGLISVDMDKAREIYRQKLRELRKPKLEKLDVAYAKADESGDVAAKKAIAAQKQSLRDVTLHSGITSAKTPDELKAVLPDCLR